MTYSTPRTGRGQGPSTHSAGNGHLNNGYLIDPIDRVLGALDVKGCDPQRKGGQWLAKCPAHNDANPSLAIKVGNDGTVLVHCRSHQCSAKSITEAIGLQTKDLFRPMLGRGGSRAKPRPKPVENDDQLDEKLAEWHFAVPTGDQANRIAKDGANTIVYGCDLAGFIRGKDRRIIVIETVQDEGLDAAQKCADFGAKEVFLWTFSGLDTFPFRLNVAFEEPWVENADTVRKVGATPPRPDVEISTERHVVRDQAVEALTRDKRVFTRGDMLAMAIRPPETTTKLFGGVELRNASGTPRVVTLDEPNLGCLLTENAKFFKWGVDKRGEAIARDCHPPDWLIKAVLARKVWPGIPELLSVTECPYVRPDGTVVSKAGYDASTGTLLMPSFQLGHIPDRPTQDQVAKAVDVIVGPVGQFPFAEPGVDLSVWVAALLTAIQRPTISGPVPGFAFNGNKAGCGKGLLIDTIGILVWGGCVPTVGYPRDPAEAEKTTLALALAGVQAVHYDNLAEGRLYGDESLDSAMTTTAKGGRILGASKMVDGIPLRPCWFLSGNNVSPAKDAYRRWVPCNLQTDLERPYEREDLAVKNLRDHVSRSRAAIVTSALTILRAHAVEGRPSHGKGPLGSFEAWDEVVRAAVWFAMQQDCLQTQRKAADESPERLAKLALIEGWAELPGGDTSGHTAEEAIKAVRDFPDRYPTLQSALMAMGTKGELPTSKTLGHRIGAIKLQNHEGRRFEQNGLRHKVAVWKVSQVNPGCPA